MEILFPGAAALCACSHAGDSSPPRGLHDPLFSLLRVRLILLPMAVTTTARVPFVMTAVASIRVGRVQVQKIDLDNMLLGIHLIQMIHHSNDSFGTF